MLTEQKFRHDNNVQLYKICYFCVLYGHFQVNFNLCFKTKLLQNLMCTQNLTFTQKLRFHTKLDVHTKFRIHIKIDVRTNLDFHTKLDFYTKLNVNMKLSRCLRKTWHPIKTVLSDCRLLCFELEITRCTGVFVMYIW